MIALKRAIFLAASFPSGERGARFVPHNAAEIADAVTALARAILVSGGRLVFGGHPTITPLVFSVASEHARQGAVEVYQSRWFEHEIAPETRRLEELGFGRILWTEKKDTLQDSLDVMRRTMLREANPIAGLFVGGMEGILDEWHLFGEMLKGPRFRLVRPGGAAATLDQPEVSADLSELLKSGRYPVVAHEIVRLLAAI